MIRFLRSTAFAVLATLTACATSHGPNELATESTLLISFDGLRWDYPDKVDTPALDRMENDGARVRQLTTVFPVETFPNHYTVVTGLRPVNHGIISNNMYDPEFDAYFSLGSNPENQKPRWWDGEPIWVTALKQDRRASAFFWPGSDVEIDGHIPEPWNRFDANVPYDTRWTTVVDWLKQPVEHRPHLVTLYFELLDNVGHFNGPDAPETADAIRQADGYVGSIISALETAGVLDQVNIIVTGDHGMAPVFADSIVFLDDVIDLARADVVHWSPVLALNVDNDYLDEAYNLITGTHGLTVYRNGETPAHWNYTNHRRVTSLVGVADNGWTITSRSFYNNNGQRVSPGAHGYDPENPDMYTTLFAMGPSIRRGARVDISSNLNVYEMLAQILNIEPAANDGDRSLATAVVVPND